LCALLTQQAAAKLRGRAETTADQPRSFSATLRSCPYKDEYKVDRDDAGLQMANMESAVVGAPSRSLNTLASL
jgi:hypothetical protein